MQAVALQAVARRGDSHRSLRRKVSHAIAATGSYCICKLLQPILAIANYCMLSQLLQPIALQASASRCRCCKLSHRKLIASYCKPLCGYCKPLLLLQALALQVSWDIASYCIAHHYGYCNLLHSKLFHCRLVRLAQAFASQVYKLLQAISTIASYCQPLRLLQPIARHRKLLPVIGHCYGLLQSVAPID